MVQKAKISNGVKTKKHWALCGWPMIFGWLAMLIFAFHASTHMVGAGDTWVAMACGRHFINHGVDTVEPFSANSHKAGPTKKEIKTWPNWAQRVTDKVGLATVKRWHPTGWVNQNWLTHVIFYWLTHESPFADAKTFSFNSLVYWKFAIYVLTVISVYYTARVLGVNPALSAVFACFAMFAGRSFFDIRPAGFSNLLVAVFLLILALTTYRNVLYIWLIVPLVVFWCNVHGGYVYAFIMLAVFFILHLLIASQRRWTVALHSILMWAGLYAITYKFLDHQALTQIPPATDRIFYLLLVLIAASLITAAIKRTKNEVLYGYHIVASIIVFFTLLPRFFPSIPSNLTQQAQRLIKVYVSSSQFFFISAFFGLAALGLVVVFLKNRLVSIKLKGVYHTAAVGLVAFLAMIIFNPFHLTNLTHTFVISLSKHAKMWRTVREWHPAFEWSNPIGTGFPFLVLLILSIGLLALWLFSRFLKPRFLKAPKNELEAQKKLFTILSKILGCAAAVFICWVTFISFSFVKVSPASFFICVLFVGILLLSIYKSVHFIYLAVLLVLLALHFAGPRAGYTGRYIYPFVLLPAYVTLHIFVSLLSKNIKTRPRNIIFVAVTAIIALLLMVVIFNPFKFNLPVWNLKQFLNLHRMWHPKYERNLGLKYTHLFSVLYIVNVVSIIIWFALPFLRRVFRRSPNRIAEEPQADTYQLPKIDLALIAIAALTIYMAFGMRRFIPIAAIAACPIVAMFIDQMIRVISAARNFHKQNRFSVSPMPYNLQLFFTFVAAVAVLTFGTWWGLKFKRIYLDPWPTDPKLNSVFMRMTASDVKPFYACRFIKDNKLEGKMFNYWTEGGFIAWGQEPDPDTGRTPLQLFMDGRAQAAYEPKTYKLWFNIMSGGPTVRTATIRKHKLNAADYKEIGRWIDKQLKKYNVWVVLMPRSQFKEAFVKGLEYNPNWPLVYFDGEQKLFVDKTTPQGRKLLEGIFNGKTLYPDEFSKNLIFAHYLLLPVQEKAKHKQGLDFAIKAFKLNPSRVPMQKILSAARFPQLTPRVNDFCKSYIADFEKNKNHYVKQSGYNNRMVAVVFAVNFLEKIAEKEKNAELEQSYKAKRKEYDKEIKQLVKGW